MLDSRVKRSAREAMVAGIFYPDDPSRLESRIVRAIAAAREASSRDASPPAAAGKILAILAPHAAFDYSIGLQATSWLAAATSLVARAPERVIVLGPTRRRDEPGVYLPEVEAFQTPLGDIEVDVEVCEELESCCTLFSRNDIPHFESHSIELQLPFMRLLFPGARLVPILACGDATVASGLARAMDAVLGADLGRTLVVASSNMAASIVAADSAGRTDELLRCIARDAWRDVASRDDIGGSAAIAAAMAVAPMLDRRFSLLGRGDSLGHEKSSAERVVQYASAGWYRIGAAPGEAL